MKKLIVLLMVLVLCQGSLFARSNPIQVLNSYQEIGALSETVTATGNNWVSYNLPTGGPSNYTKMINYRVDNVGFYNWTVVQDDTKLVSTGNTTGTYQKKPLDGLLGLETIYPPANAVSVNVNFTSTTGAAYFIFYGIDKNQD